MNFQDLYDIFESIGNEPYPKFEKIEKNYNFGRQLYDSYAGRDGELTAILQYTYEQITNKDGEELNKILRRIAIDEMHHLDILGNLLTELGFIPYYMSSRNNKWCSDNIQYKFKGIKDMIKYNIRSEEIAIKEYCRLIEMTDCKCIQRILGRIMKDEEAHLKIFKMLENKYCK